MTKKIFVTLGVSCALAAFGFMACSDDSSGESSPAKPSTGDVSEESVKSVDDLPACLAKRENAVMIVSGEDAAYICTDKKWLLLGDVLASEADLVSCTEKRKGDRVYLAKNKLTLLCDGKKWNEIDSDEIEDEEFDDDEKSSSSVAKSSSSVKKDDFDDEDFDDVKSSSSVKKDDFDDENVDDEKSSSSSAKGDGEKKDSLIVVSAKDASDYSCSASEVMFCANDYSGSYVAGIWQTDTYSQSIGLSTLNCSPDCWHDLGKHVAINGSLHVTGTVASNTGMNEYAGFGYDIAGANGKTWDIKDWEGMCLVYKSTNSFTFGVALTDEMNEKMTQWDHHQVRVPAAKSKSVVNVPWSQFKQAWHPTDSVAAIDFDIILGLASKMKFGLDVGSTTLDIYAIGKYGTCN